MNRVEYDKIHGWLRRNFKKSRICSHCGTTDSKYYDWALRKGFEYKKDLSHFIELCRKCHVIYDYTEDHKINQSISQKENYNNNPERSKNQGKYRRKVIEQYNLNNELIDTFPSAREAERQTKINISSITKCCNNTGQYKSAGGFIWKYKNN